jgi:hypothetical protein
MVHEKSFMLVNAARYDGGKDQPKAAAQRPEPSKRNVIALLCLNNDAQNREDPWVRSKDMKRAGRNTCTNHVEHGETSSEEKACIELGRH